MQTRGSGFRVQTTEDPGLGCRLQTIEDQVAAQSLMALQVQGFRVRALEAEAEGRYDMDVVFRDQPTHLQ